jgi:hypothetical protein
MTNGLVLALHQWVKMMYLMMHDVQDNLLMFLNWISIVHVRYLGKICFEKQTQIED